MPRSGKPCGVRDGHKGPHRSVESVNKKRACDRDYHQIQRLDPSVRRKEAEYNQRYLGTSAGILSKARSNAKRRGNR